MSSVKTHLDAWSRRSLFWFVAALLIYVLAAGWMTDEKSLAPHYVYLADALLHGQINLIETSNLYDLLIAPDGRAYVAGSPLPAVLLMPFVALFGNDFADVLPSIILGALNIALVQYLFRKRWLTLLFAVGTPYLYMAALGSVWLQAHLVAITFGLLALLAALRWDRWFVAGLFIMLAGMARPTMLFGAAFFAVYLLLTRRNRPWLRQMVLLIVPLLLGVLLHSGYNAVRFGRPLDFGYQYTAGAPNVIAAYAEYGGFNPHFLGCNLFVSLFNPPLINGNAPAVLSDACDHLLAGVDFDTVATTAFEPNPIGMSIFLVTPACFLLLAALRRTPLTIAAWVGLLATMIPLWLYHNTGSSQFGYRYWFDAAPFWLLLLAENDPTDLVKSGQANRLVRILAKLKWPLIALSIIIAVWGFLWMYQLFVGFGWWELLWQPGLRQ
ncbi:MAG: hypothetical protein M9928_03825 [Anaerolineae bacterium]|nr:hypothetical protein [Anaerolineae bacterium]MCO5189538.1 hypothetical protein [Anaerolineae bacterium]MCO5192251.1 hypothetical protein [Anaerolineae bacterium]MCO5204133.1 hypothetical protein [Anaerolineae bacterium]